MAGYVGERPGSCGLFTDEGSPVVLSKVKDEIEHHTGNVWGLILSLKREDAERLGYNSAEQWINLLRSRRNDIAREMHIAPENLRWYAAFHQKEEHPHAHMLVWSSNPREPFLSRDGIHNIKKVIAGDIFRQDLISVYKRQTEIRDYLRAQFRERMKEITDEIRSVSFDNPVFEMKFYKLAERLKRINGKKQYGYLDRNTKKQVNEIVKLIASEPHIAELYDLWYKCQCEIRRTYTDAMPEKLPLEINPEFKAIRNAVVKSASEFVLPELEVPSFDLNANENDIIREAKRLYAEDKYDDAWKILMSNPSAQVFNFLGDAFSKGEIYKRNSEKATDFYGLAAERGSKYAYYRLGEVSLEDGDTDDALYYFENGAEENNEYCAYTLWKAYSDGRLPVKRNDALHYLRQASDRGLAAASYALGKELLDTNRELAREYLLKAYDGRDSYAAYTLGKMYYDDGDKDKALYYLQRSATVNSNAQLRLGLLYYYEFGNREEGMEYLEQAADNGNTAAQNAVKAINENRNAMIATNIVDLFYYASNIIEDNTGKHYGDYDGIDSRLKREIREKKQAQGMHM